MDISNTLQKVEKALDLRFERDSSLYISKEDTEHIKEALYHSKFQNINAFIRKFGNKIIGKIILSNSWLIDFNKNKRELQKIFDTIDKEFLKDIAKDIVEDKIFSTTEFKLFIEQYYLRGISLKNCLKIYQNTNKLIESRVTCFQRYLSEEYILENSSSSIVRFIDSEFKEYPGIYSHLQVKNPNFLKSIFDNYNEISDVIEWIILNKITDRRDKIWNRLFLSNKDIALEQSINYISNYPSWDNTITKYLIQKILVKLENVDRFKESIVESYDNNWEIRLLFIHMLEPPKFKNKDLANKILDSFRDIGVPNKGADSIQKIRDWKETDESYNTKEDLMNSIKSNNQDFTNLKTLEYYTFCLNKTEKEVILDTYSDFSSNKELKLLLSYYLAKFLSKRTIPKYFEEINIVEYIDEITNFIIKLNINTKFSKSFLEKNKKYEELARLNQR